MTTTRRLPTSNRGPQQGGDERLQELITRTVDNGPESLLTLERNFGNFLLSLFERGIRLCQGILSHPFILSESRQPFDCMFGLACPRTQGKLSLVGVETHDTCASFLLRFPIQMASAYRKKVDGGGVGSAGGRSCREETVT